MSGDDNSKKWVVIMIGPPGSGKDTQADLLSRELGLEEVKMSALINKKLDSAPADDPVMNQERELKRSGQLNSGELVNQWLDEAIADLAKKGNGFVLNGALRRVLEAEHTLNTIQKYYDLQNLKIVQIALSQEESVTRNSHRRVCQANRHPIPNFPEFADLKTCPQDGSPIMIREDDSPETVKKRYEVYLEESKPVIDFLSKKGYNIIAINGEQKPEDVHREILNKLW